MWLVERDGYIKSKNEKRWQARKEAKRLSKKFKYEMYSIRNEDEEDEEKTEYFIKGYEVKNQ